MPTPSFSGASMTSKRITTSMPLSSARLAVREVSEHDGAKLPADASLRGTQRTRDDVRHDALELPKHLVLANPQHVPPEVRERALARAIMPRALFMVRPINLDDEAHLGAREVDDVLTDDELPAKRKPGLGPREAAPEPLFRARGTATHAERMLFEQLGASRRDKSTTKHEDLHEVGADARRAKPPSAACVTRDARNPSPHPSRAARKVRARSSARGRAGRRLSGSACVTTGLSTMAVLGRRSLVSAVASEP